MNLDEKLLERGQLVTQMRAINDLCLKESRAKTADEAEKYAKLDAAQMAIGAAAAEARRLDLAETDNKQRTADPIRAAIEKGDKTLELRASADYARNYVAWAKHGDASTPMDIKASLQKATGSQGGYLVPTIFETEIVRKMYDANLMRRLGRVTRTTSLVNIALSANLPTFGWVDELGTFPQTDTTVAQNTFGMYKMGGTILVSEELLDDAFTDVAAYVADESGIAAGFTEEAAFLLGDGNKKPTGLLTTIAASGTTVTSAAPATVGTADVFKLYYGLSRPYRKNATFVFTDTAMLGIRSEKSTTGQYIWQPGLAVDAPDTLLGKPVETSDFIPAVTAGAVTGVFGDFSYYRIMDRVGWSMKRLNELYSQTGQIGFQMWERVDAKCLRPEAFVALQQHA